MGASKDKESRRNFIKTTGAVAGAAALASAIGGTGEVQAVEINAMTPTPQQMQAFMALPDEGPIVMVNLLKFKPDGGMAEYMKYSAGVGPILEKIGAKILFSGRAEFCLIGNGDWDMIALVQYPRKKALFDMAQSEEYQAIHHYRDAGLEGQVNYAVVQMGGTV